MKVTNYEEYDDLLQVSAVTEDEELYFEYRFDIEDFDRCRLNGYYKTLVDGTKITVRGSLNNDILVCENKNLYRTIGVDEDGYVDRDFIKYNEREPKVYKNINIRGKVELNEYLASSPKTFASNDGEIISSEEAKDEYFIRFLEVDKKYSPVIGKTLMDAEEEHEEFRKMMCKKIENRVNTIK